MSMNIEIPKAVWDKIIATVTKRLAIGSLEKPIVFALYTTEDDYRKVVDYREIPTVRVKGDYPNGEYEYTYPGIKALGFYPPKGKGRWFSGTLVVGDGTTLSEVDMKWMIREQVYFRIKIEKGHDGQLYWKAYCIDFPAVSLDLL
jgi:hypothetical protein